VACGDGVYARWLAERVGRPGHVVAIDCSHAYLELAERQTESNADRAPVRFIAASIDRLPFARDTFDVVWCAQSLYSLPDPVDALRRMREVVRPGGLVAVLENDSLHHILLPWPVEVELAVRRAELRGFRKESDRPRKFYIGRQLPGLFRAAGLANCQARTWATDRQAPLNRHERSFLERYLLDLKERAVQYLEPHLLERFQGLVDPESDAYLLAMPDFSMTCLDHVVWGFKPTSPARS
jgi:SAM-dependent methyltransferase